MKSLKLVFFLVGSTAVLYGCSIAEEELIQTVRLTAAPTGQGVVKGCGYDGCSGSSSFSYDDGSAAGGTGFLWIDCREGSDAENRCTSSSAADALTIDRGIAVRLEATPDSGNRLVGWTGCTADMANPLQCSTTIDALTPHRVVGATFAPVHGDQVAMTLNWFEAGDLDLSVTPPSGTSCSVEQRDSGSDASRPVYAERIRCHDAAAGHYEMTVQNHSASELSYTLSVEVLAGGVSIAADGYPVKAILPHVSARTHSYTH